MQACRNAKCFFEDEREHWEESDTPLGTWDPHLRFK